MAVAIQVPSSTDPSRLDATLTRLRAGATGWANAPVDERIAVARGMLAGYLRVAERQVEAACAAKGLAYGTAQEGEEWLAGVYPTVRILRQTIEQLESIQLTGTTTVGPLSRTIDGRLSTRIFPMNLADKLAAGGVTCDVHVLAGVDEAAFERDRARWYKRPDHEGKIALVLGAGNVNSIPPTDVITKMFLEGKVCVLKMNPVNAYVGPLLEEAWSDLLQRDWLAVVYGGAEEGKYLCEHPLVDEIHITGSDKTHDMIVWGPPGPEREERKRRNDPLLKKEISSELGNVSPVLVVPGPWDDKTLGFQAENIAGMMTNNASFNCNAAKMVITPKGFAKRDWLFDRIMAKAGETPARKAWYPGAKDRYAKLTKERKGVRTAGAAGADALPWTLIPGLDAGDANELAFSMEPFCSIVSATEVGSSEDPIEFLDRAVSFANDKLWGTLVATLVVHPKTLKDPSVADAFERAITRLKYGAVGVNLWPSYAFALGDTPWGAHPSSRLADIQSGRGWVHNTHMLEHIEKVVVRAPVTQAPKPPYFPSHKSARELGRALVAFDATGSWLKFPAVAIAGLKG